MAKPRNNVKDYLACQAMKLFEMCVRMVPVGVCYDTARWIGDVMYRLDGRHRRRAMEHLRRSFPHWNQQQIDQAARGSMRSLVYLGLEVMLTTRLLTPHTWRRHVHLSNMQQALRLLLEDHRGLIMLTGHFGNWEVVGYTLATLGFPTVAIARSLDNPYLNEHVLGIRERTGMKIVDKSGATQSVQEVLDRHGVVGFIADQDAGRKGAFVDFFGRKAATYKIIALMAMEYDVPVVIGYGRRLGAAFEFEIGVQQVILPSQWADKPDPVMWITQEYTKALEEVVRRTPEQYLWVHRRWKHRPKGEEQPADGIA